MHILRQGQVDNGSHKGRETDESNWKSEGKEWAEVRDRVSDWHILLWQNRRNAKDAGK